MIPYGLGCKQSPLDIHDYKLAAYEPLNLGDLSGETEWPFNHVSLDQRTTPRCVGYGLAGFGINTPIEDNYTDADGDRFYGLCKAIDGDMEEGSTVRTGAKVLVKEGRIKKYAFANSVDEITYWLLHNGPVIAGASWTMDMFRPDSNNVIHPTGEVAGGHCFVLNAKYKTDMFRLRCAWGDGWGVNGEVLISIADFAKLFRAGGEVLTAVEEPLSVVGQVPAVQQGCTKALLKAFGISV